MVSVPAHGKRRGGILEKTEWWATFGLLIPARLNRGVAL
jgi:hypothetical protein